ncbi:MAG TPA: hypothetical protein VFT31_00375 [Kribbella sp.]|nr:hypothetical protein [Kribbella sp.]
MTRRKSLALGGMVMAGALMSVIPLIGAFIIGGRHFIADIVAGAMKF